VRAAEPPAFPIDERVDDVRALYTGIFRALSEPLRLEIISMFAELDELPCTVIEERLPITKSTISYHIKILARARLVSVRKEGRFYFYRLRLDVFEWFVPGLLHRMGVDAAALA
jgi:DNA-binding transcriptional ArsR family regulator